MQATDAVCRAELLAVELLLKGSRSRAAEVVDLSFANPIMTVRHVQRTLNVSQPGAANLLRTLTELGVVREVGIGPGVRHRWFADNILEVLVPDLAQSEQTVTNPRSSRTSPH